MANFTNPIPAPGAYANGDVLATAVVNELADDITKAVNGDEGGEYDGDLVWNGDHTMTGQTTRSGLLLPSGSGARTLVRKQGLSDAAADITTAYDTYLFRGATVGNRTLHARNADATLGDHVLISIQATSGSQTWTITNEGGTTLATVTTGTGYGWVYLEHSGANWFVCAWGGAGVAVP